MSAVIRSGGADPPYLRAVTLGHEGEAGAGAASDGRGDRDSPGDETGDGGNGCGGNGYADDLAAIATLDRLRFGPITVLAGDNGSGKSTVVEALAVAAGFNPEGGSRNLRFATNDTHSSLHERLVLEWTSRPSWGWFLRAETFYGMATHIEADDDPYGGIAHLFPDLHARSHGESFLSLIESRCIGPGLYLFDEPESALSIQGQMALSAIVGASVAAGGQFVIATHSPLLMALPGARLHELDAETGIAEVDLDDLTSTALWRRFFADPASFHARLLPE